MVALLPPPRPPPRLALYSRLVIAVLSVVVVFRGASLLQASRCPVLPPLHSLLRPCTADTITANPPDAADQ